MFRLTTGHQLEPAIHLLKIKMKCVAQHLNRSRQALYQQRSSDGLPATRATLEEWLSLEQEINIRLGQLPMTEKEAVINYLQSFIPPLFK